MVGTGRRNADRALAAVVVAGLVWATTACATSEPPRPDPTEVVAEYLGAIAAGDATRARQLDAAAIGDPQLPDVDADTLRTDAVLAGAQRIENVTVEADTTGDEDTRNVTFGYELAGQQERSVLTVAWNAEADEWQLTDSLTTNLMVSAEVSRIEMKFVSFEVPGATVTQVDDPAAATMSFLIYPAVYSVTADIDPATLVDPAAGITQEIAVDLSVHPVARFAVTRLPASG
ncbi:MULTISPECIES: hypothetical protein [Microbacterium]|uniref:DUF4878 domain-containing protein n=1 Tax=Microbacterium wangchenii TaxID=2541726 RepID=A0ABX5SR63_9MICO|nr:MULTISPECIES: hypothetical protein [Microbacterium]MCK6066398.1 hypothetical protein [Microbacterium sp. EYE_512]QBR87365.1 hypothetical protein E4K62_00800 [Microbacterium wangchenii]TXK14687.1 hypothetical protein FVP99_13380 [Microbacterium wangchenii]